MGTARKILANTVAQILGKIAVAVLGLLVVKISTQYLTVEGFGEYTIIYEFLAFFGIIADFGLFTIAVREMSEDEDNIPKIIGNIISLRTILIIFAMIAAAVVIFFMPTYQNTRVPLGVIVASFTVFFTIANGTITSVLQVKLKMHIASIMTVIGKVVSLLFMVYVVFFGFETDKETGFYMLIFAGTIGSFFTMIGTNYYVKKITPLKYRFDFDLWKQIVKKSAPYGLALILSTIYFRINSILISVIKGQEEVGIFGVAMKMLEHFAILPLYFMNSVLPVLTKAVKEKQKKYKTMIRYAFDFLASLSVPMVVGGVILAYPIVFVVSNSKFLSRLDEGFYGSDIAFQILIFALLFQFLNVLFTFILIAVGRQGKLLYVNSSCVLFNIILNIILIPHYGFRGAAVTSVLSEMFILIFTWTLARRYLEFSVNLLNLVKIIFSSLVMGAVIWALQPITYSFIQNWNVLVLVPLGGLIYAIMLFATKTVTRETLNLFKKNEESIVLPSSNPPLEARVQVKK